jgi:hypothetical protein
MKFKFMQGNPNPSEMGLEFHFNPHRESGQVHDTHARPRYSCNKICGSGPLKYKGLKKNYRIIVLLK